MTARVYRYHWEDFPFGSSRDIGPPAASRDETAPALLFGRLSASGWHTCAMAMRMTCDAYLLDTAGLGSPGVDQVRWLKPVFPGDTLRGRMTVIGA